MKKLLVLLVLLPVFVMAQYNYNYVKPRCTIKSTTSGHVSQFKVDDTVYVNWTSVSPGLFSFGLSAQDSCKAYITVWGRMHTNDDVTGALTTLVTDSLVTTTKGSKLVTNVAVAQDRLKIMIRFVTGSVTARKTAATYQPMYLKQGYKY